METPVYEFVHRPHEVLAVRYSGEQAQAHMLIAHNWLDSADMGFGRDNAGSGILRGLVGEQVVFPGDIIALRSDLTRHVYQIEMFMATYEQTTDEGTEPVVSVVLSDGQEPPPEAKAIDSVGVPDGSNPDAVNLENPAAQAAADQGVVEDATAKAQALVEQAQADRDAAAASDAGAPSTTEPTTASGSDAATTDPGSAQAVDGAVDSTPAPDAQTT